MIRLLAALLGIAFSLIGSGQALGATGDYAVSLGTSSIVPGTVDTGNHCDDCVVTVGLPFPYALYETSFTSVHVSSNGNLQFGSFNSAFANTCLPTASMDYLISPHWDDLRTDGTGLGVFTSVSGTAPHRIFNIEWRAFYLGTTTALDFEVRLHEGTATFDFVYGAVPQQGGSATTGVQHSTGDHFTQTSCNSGVLSPGLEATFTLPPTAARIAGLTAGPGRGGEFVSWRTASETDVLGFNLYRERGGRVVKVNRRLIASVFGGTVTGHSYSWLDRTAPAGRLVYRLQAVSLDGSRAWLGTAPAQPRYN